MSDRGHAGYRMALRTAALLLGLLLALGATPAMLAAGASRTVTIQSFAFTPLTITVGDTVTWQNRDDTTHTATSDTNAFDTGQLAPGASSRTIPFGVAGTFAYHCSIHPTMHGSIVVQAATAAPTPTPPPTAPPATPRPTPPPTSPPTAAPTVLPTAPPTPSLVVASASAPPSQIPSASPAPLATTVAIPATPTSLAVASPGGDAALGSGPGPLIAAIAAVLALSLAGFAITLYRRR